HEVLRWVTARYLAAVALLSVVLYMKLRFVNKNVAGPADTRLRRRSSGQAIPRGLRPVACRSSRRESLSRGLRSTQVPRKRVRRSVAACSRCERRSAAVLRTRAPPKRAAQRSARFAVVSVRL